MEHIMIPEKYADRADYAFRVTGDSLEPIYSDGDHILVQKQPKVKPGELGVFEVNGEKRLLRLTCQAGEYKLLPLDPAYPEARLVKGVRCLGRVIGRV